MTRVLILGANGMLGHQLYAACLPHFDTFGTLRGDFARVERFGIFDRARIVTGVNAQHPDTLSPVFEQIKPEVVINCIGAIKQSAAGKDPIQSISVNSLFPHQVAQMCAAAQARLIHISTDCVFSGKQGNYAETASPDADDLYGRSKLLGEVIDQPHALTIRTSMIGFELDTQYGLLEWFLSNRGGTVNGYTRAVFSGLTTPALSRLIVQLITAQPTLTGLYHVSAAAVDKFTLLTWLNAALNAGIHITPTDTLMIDRSLNSTRFRAALQWEPPTWEAMIAELTP